MARQRLFKSLIASVLLAVLLPHVADATRYSKGSLRRLQQQQNTNNSTYQVHRAKDADLNDKLSTYMKKALVSSMATQVMPTHAECLMIGHETIRFEDEHLTPYRITTDGSNAHLYNVENSGRQFSTVDDTIVRVLKRDGVVRSVTKYVLATGEKIHADLMDGPDGDGTYATFSTNDLDYDALEQLEVDEVQVPPASLRRLMDQQIRSSIPNVDGRSLQAKGTCASYTVLRIDVRFDSAFCAINGGYQSAVDAIHSILAEVNDPFNAYPLCVKVETCNVSGFCNPKNRPDPYQQIMAKSEDVCLSLNNRFLENFRQYIYPAGTSRNDLYPQGQCDVTHLFYGDETDPFPNSSSIGCAYGAVCYEYAVGVNQVGKRTNNKIAQAVMVAHELGHNLNAQHDPEYGYLMYKSICPECERFSPTSIDAMTKFANQQGDDRCLPIEKASLVQSKPLIGPASTKPPTSVPTKPPTLVPTKPPTLVPTKPPTLVPTKSPTPAPTMRPTTSPTPSPTKSPTPAPTKSPTLAPSKPPTHAPTRKPTRSPIEPPTTETPSLAPLTPAPTKRPTRAAPVATTRGQARSSPPSATESPSTAPTTSGAPAMSEDAASLLTKSKMIYRTNKELKSSPNAFKKISDPPSLPPLPIMDNDDVDRCRGKFFTAESCNSGAGYSCSWIQSLGECWKRSDLVCSDFESQGGCLFHGTNCAWNDDDGTCADPCSGIISVRACSYRTRDRCAWSPSLGECRVRHKVPCEEYSGSRYQCKNFGTFCLWDPDARTCSDAAEAPANDPDACSTMTSEFLCVRDRFRLCTWNANASACWRRDAMECREYAKPSYCNEHGAATPCGWNALTDRCVELD